MDVNLRATGDLVRTAVSLLDASTPEVFLEWLGQRVWTLRTAREASCGAAGMFTTGPDKGTVEIRPPTSGAPNTRRVLDFRPSPALEAAVAAPLPENIDALTVAEGVPRAFSQALALELAAHGRATIGNFGTWSLGKKPTLEMFVRFRPHPAINQRL